jgi:hypothetical protein
MNGQCASVRGIPASSVKTEEYPPYSFLWYLCVFSAGANKCFGIYMLFQMELTNALASLCFFQEI